MRILLDTHIFLWYISRDSRLPANLREPIENADNAVFLSVASLWEALVKHQLGKLPFPESPHTYLPRQRERHAIHSLPIDEESVKELANLPTIHRDPFDRILICQARRFDMALATVDSKIIEYEVTILGS